MEKSNKELVKVITEYKETSVVVGAQLFMSVEDARAILERTTHKFNKDDGTMHDDNQAMLFEARHTLRVLAKAVLFSGTAPNTTLAEISSKYLNK
jgi:hypothetical protein